MCSFHRISSRSLSSCKTCAAHTIIAYGYTQTNKRTLKKLYAIHMGLIASLKTYYSFGGQVQDSSCREMRCHLRANETPNMEALLNTRQVTEVQERWAPSTETHRRTIVYLPVSLLVPPFTLIDCFHPVITSWSHHFHPLTAIVSLFTLLLSAEFSFLSSIVHISPSHLCLLLIPLLCFALPPPYPSSPISHSSSLSFSSPQLYL